MLQVFVFLALLFSIVIAIFAVQNTTPVDVRFLTLSIEDVAVSVLVLISAALGAAAIMLLGTAREVRLRWRTHSLSTRLRATEAKLKEAEAAAVPPPAAEPPPAEPVTPALPEGTPSTVMAPSAVVPSRTESLPPSA